MIGSKAKHPTNCLFPAQESVYIVYNWNTLHNIDEKRARKLSHESQRFASEWTDHLPKNEIKKWKMAFSALQMEKHAIEYFLIACQKF